MNPDLDRLFEQARKELRAEMPIEAVEQLIQRPASTSFWKRNKYQIMGTSFFISMLALIGLSFWPLHSSISTENKIISSQPATTAQAKVIPPVFSDPINSSSKTVFHFTENSPKNLLYWQDQQASNSKEMSSGMDSLIPKETFREYQLTIRDDNSEQDLRKLKTELKNYGIYLEITKLDYDEEKRIKNFAGQFTTDSLFCNGEEQNHNFNISGTFDDITFTFRVAKDKNLKYLKIASNNFEETIECYDDGVIANISAAKKQHELAEMEMNRARADIEKAKHEIEKAKHDIEHAIHDMDERFNTEFKFQFEEQLNNFHFEFDSSFVAFKNKDWTKLSDDIRRELKESLKNFNGKDFSKELEEEMKALKEALKDMEDEIENEIREVIDRQREKDRGGHRSSEDLKEEAKELKRAYKEVKKEAKRMAKEEKKDHH